ncbi:MAG: ATP-binding cassette domain-containing protein [Streptosporangiales bacterium]|nr:ATP-binding cassette domain-containing protein [Streptosporangiales bacterium]
MTPDAAQTAVGSATAGLVMEHVTAGYLSHDIVLDDVSLWARTGQVTAVLGPNGSGKSTALRVLYGFLQPRTGRITLAGADVTRVPVDARTALGMALLPQGRSVFPQLTVLDNLRLGAWHLRRRRSALTAAVDAMFDRYPTLRQVRDKPAGSLSGGQARLLEFGRTLVLDPAVILIDEPSVGLSPVLVDTVYDELGRIKREGRTVLLVEQNVQAAVELADYVYTLAYGRNHLDGERAQFGDRLDQLIKSWLQLDATGGRAS